MKWRGAASPAIKSDIADHVVTTTAEGPPPPSAVKGGTKAAEPEPDDVTLIEAGANGPGGEVIWEDADEEGVDHEAVEAAGAAQPKKETSLEWRRRVVDAMQACKEMVPLGELHAKEFKQKPSHVDADDYHAVMVLYARAIDRINMRK